MSEAPLFVDVAGMARGDLRAVCSGEVRILFGNADGELYAIENKCPHIQIPLDGGRLIGFVLECPLHGGKIDVRDGSPVSQPIRKRVATYTTRTSNGAVEVSLKGEQQETDNA